MKVIVFALLIFGLLAFALLHGISLKRRSYMSKPTEPPLTPEQLKRLVGRTGRAIGLMIPTGKVDFDGIIADAILEGISVKSGEMVRAVRVDGQRLVVVPANMKVIPVEQV